MLQNCEDLAIIISVQKEIPEGKYLDQNYRLFIWLAKKFKSSPLSGDLQSLLPSSTPDSDDFLKHLQKVILTNYTQN